MKNIKNYDSFANEGKININVDDFFKAAETGYIEELTRLLKIVDVNSQDKDGWTALMLASINGHTDCVKLLIDNGADANLQNEVERSALIYAASDGYKECVKLLIDNGADVNSQSEDGWSALMLASYNGYKECVKLLIKNGSLVDIHNNENKTVLNYSCNGIWKNSEVQEYIIKKQPWNIKFFDDIIGFRPELKVKYEDVFYASDLNI